MRNTTIGQERQNFFPTHTVLNIKRDEDCHPILTKNRANQQKQNSEQQPMKLDNVNQQIKVHAIPNQHTLFWRNNLAIQKLQNCKKENSPNGFLLNRNITTKYTKQ